VYWFSPRLCSLLDYFMHKAPYWSVNNYEQRVDEGVRTVFSKHVEKVHTDNRAELAGMFGEALLSLPCRFKFAPNAFHRLVSRNSARQIFGRIGSGTMQSRTLVTVARTREVKA
jgi:hypothetical protein